MKKDTLKYVLIVLLVIMLVTVVSYYLYKAKVYSLTTFDVK